MVRVLHVDPELLQREHVVPRRRRSRRFGARRQIEVAALVEDLRHPALGAGVPEVEVLELGADVEVVEAHALGPLERPKAPGGSPSYGSGARG